MLNIQKLNWFKSNFFFLLFCQILMELSDQLLSISFAVQVYKTFGTGAALSTYFLARTIPVVIFGPLAGVMSDRLDKRKLVILTCLITAVIILLLPFTKSIISILLVTFVLSTANTLFNPSIQSMLPMIIDKEHLLEANSIISATESIARFVAPALSAILVIIFGSAAGFYTTSILTALAGLALIPLKLPKVANALPKGKISVLSVYDNIIEGVKYIWQSRLLIWVAITASCVMLADATVSPLFTIMVERELHTPPASIGYLSSLFGIGFLVGTMVLPFLKNLKVNNLLIVGVFFIGIQMGLYSFIHQFWMTVPLQIMCGLGFAFFFNTMRTIIQFIASENIVGRIIASISTFYTFISLFGIKLGGFIADVMGVRIVFLSCSIICLTAGFLFLFSVNTKIAGKINDSPSIT